MARKFDRRGWNRQFKWHPCSRRHPYPYHLPFVDDFSVAATVHAQQTTKIPRRALGPAIHPHDMRSPDKDSIMKEHAQKRAASEIMSRAHKRQKLFPHYPQHKKTRHEKMTDALFYSSLGLVGLYAGGLGFGAYLEAQGGPGYVALRRAQLARRYHLD